MSNKWNACRLHVLYNLGFFHHTFIWLLFTSPERRRIGVATSLIRYVEINCSTPKLFISTNESNKKMQNLMDKLGFSKTGRVENLDEGDPGLILLQADKAMICYQS